MRDREQRVHPARIGCARPFGRVQRRRQVPVLDLERHQRDPRVGIGRIETRGRAPVVGGARERDRIEVLEPVVEPQIPERHPGLAVVRPQRRHALVLGACLAQEPHPLVQPGQVETDVETVGGQVLGLLEAAHGGAPPLDGATRHLGARLAQQHLHPRVAVVRLGPGRGAPSERREDQKTGEGQCSRTHASSIESPARGGQWPSRD